MIGETTGAAETPSRTDQEIAARPEQQGAAVRHLDGAGARVEAEPDSALALVLASLEDDKAEDILAIDLRGKSSIADHMVIASGRSARHVAAICEKLLERLKGAFGVRPRAEGVGHGDWALIDAGDVVVHIFRPEVREYYALEKMWAPAQTTSGRRQSA